MSTYLFNADSPCSEMGLIRFQTTGDQSITLFGELFSDLTQKRPDTVQQWDFGAHTRDDSLSCHQPPAKVTECAVYLVFNRHKNAAEGVVGAQGAIPWCASGARKIQARCLKLRVTRVSSGALVLLACTHIARLLRWWVWASCRWHKEVKSKQDACLWRGRKYLRTYDGSYVLLFSLPRIIFRNAIHAGSSVFLFRGATINDFPPTINILVREYRSDWHSILVLNPNAVCILPKSPNPSIPSEHIIAKAAFALLPSASLDIISG